jgi:Zn-dependent protease
MGEGILQNVLDFLQDVSIWALPVLVAIVFHELAHGWVAFRLGDPTAQKMGRLTLNPFAHIDWLGTVSLPLLLLMARVPFLFGYAKPVPVNFYMLRNPKRDMVWVALAGPAMNVLLALLSSACLHLLLPLSALSAAAPESASPAGFLFPVLGPLVLMAEKSVFVNLVVAFFNLLPIPPLDGGRVVAGLLPARQADAFARIEPYGLPIVLVLLYLGSFNLVLGPVVYAFLRVLY